MHAEGPFTRPCMVLHFDPSVGHEIGRAVAVLARCLTRARLRYGASVLVFGFWGEQSTAPTYQSIGTVIRILQDAPFPGSWVAARTPGGGFFARQTTPKLRRRGRGHPHPARTQCHRLALRAHTTELPLNPKPRCAVSEAQAAPPPGLPFKSFCFCREASHRTCTSHLVDALFSALCANLAWRSRRLAFSVAEPNP